MFQENTKMNGMNLHEATYVILSENAKMTRMNLHKAT